MTLPLVTAVAFLLFALPARMEAQTDGGALRDPTLPYSSWGEAERETAAAIGDRPLVRPATGTYAVGDAVIFNDGGKRYRAHVIGIESGRYVLQYDGFGPNWTRRAGVELLLGYQPGYAPRVGTGASGAARAVRVGDELEIESQGKWREGRVIGVRGAEVRVHFDGQPRSADEWVPRSRLRYMAGGPVRTTPVAAGKYSCTASRYESRTGMYEYDPKGSVVLSADGGYEYLGFKQPSVGRYRTDPASSVVSFTGGHLGGGEATPMVQRPGKFYLTAPNIGERWVCTRTATR